MRALFEDLDDCLEILEKVPVGEMPFLTPACLFRQENGAKMFTNIFVLFLNFKSAFLDDG